MELSIFEKDIVKAIGKHYPVILTVVDLLKVKGRENTGSGMYIDLEPISAPLQSHTQILDLHGTIEVSGVELGAHIEMDNGIPDFLEICCFSKNGWNGKSDNYVIKN